MWLGAAAYQLGNTSSHTSTEVKQRWAWLVLWWVVSNECLLSKYEATVDKKASVNDKKHSDLLLTLIP